jgi:hypothetical protein
MGEVILSAGTVGTMTGNHHALSEPAPPISEPHSPRPGTEKEEEALELVVVFVEGIRVESLVGVLVRPFVTEPGLPH